MEYFGFAQSQGGEMLYCNSTDISCTVDGLECGETFNFSVEASDGVCNSSFSEPVELGAGKYSMSETTIMLQKVHALLNYRGIVPEWKLKLVLFHSYHSFLISICFSFQLHVLQMI